MYSSVKGVIFFSGSSSSAKFFWYFSQLEPVALGIFGIDVKGRFGQLRGNEILDSEKMREIVVTKS